MTFFKKWNYFLFNVLITSIISGFFSGKIAMSTWPIPISFNGFGFVTDIYTKTFTKSFQNISGNPMLVATFHSISYTNLVLPLSWCDFGINTTNFNSSIQTKSHVAFSNGSCNSIFFTNTTIILSLFFRITTSRPT